MFLFNYFLNVFPTQTKCIQSIYFFCDQTFLFIKILKRTIYNNNQYNKPQQLIEKTILQIDNRTKTRAENKIKRRKKGEEEEKKKDKTHKKKTTSLTPATPGPNTANRLDG